MNFLDDIFERNLPAISVPGWLGRAKFTPGELHFSDCVGRNLVPGAPGTTKTLPALSHPPVPTLPSTREISGYLYRPLPWWLS
jgi:hypothetical protein